jgi:hypothetical protein
MTDQYRATPEQWEVVEICSEEGKIPWPTADCILELRDTIRALCKARNDLVVCSTEQNQRIEALEAAQLEQAESHRFCTDAIVRRVEALELAHRIQSGTLTSAERAELGVVPVVDLEAAVHRAAAEARDAVMADLSHLSDAERDRMAQELAKPAAWRPLDIETTYGSEAAADAAQILRAPMVVEGTFDHGGETYRFKAKPEREAPMAELRAASAEAQPRWLVERVANAISEGDEPDKWHPEARDAIREVAAWLDDRCMQADAEEPSYYDEPTASDAVRWLRKEADRG